MAFRYSNFLLLLATLNFQPAAAWAQPRSEQSEPFAYAISGTVLDPSGAIIPGAQVTLVKEDGTSIGQTVADDKGSFRFDGMNSGKYRVLAQAVGFRDTKTDVNIGARSRAEVRITLPVDTHTESVTVAGDSAPQVNIEISGNQSSATLDRSALDRV